MVVGDTEAATAARAGMRTPVPAMDAGASGKGPWGHILVSCRLFPDAADDPHTHQTEAHGHKHGQVCAHPTGLRARGGHAALHAAGREGQICRSPANAGHQAPGQFAPGSHGTPSGKVEGFS